MAEEKKFDVTIYVPNTMVTTRRGVDRAYAEYVKDHAKPTWKVTVTEHVAAKGNGRYR